MKVSDLQDILILVGQLLQSAGGSKTAAAELADFRESLEPFRDLSAKQLAAELRKLIEGSQAKPKAPRPGKTVAVDLAGVVREVQGLYAQAADPNTTVEQIEDAVKRLEPLAKDAVVKVAEGIELVVTKSKTKKDIVAMIRQRILGRKGAAQRVNLIERSPVTNVEVQ